MPPQRRVVHGLAIGKATWIRLIDLRLTLLIFKAGQQRKFESAQRPASNLCWTDTATREIWWVSSGADAASPEGLKPIPPRVRKSRSKPLPRSPPRPAVQPARTAIGTTLASASRPSIAAASSRPHNSIARTCSGQRLAR